MTHHPPSDCEWYENGCNLGHHGGDPSAQDCAECMDYKGAARGLGDKVAKVISTLRFDTFKKKKTNEGGCRCGKRRAALNERFPVKDGN